MIFDRFEQDCVNRAQRVKFCAAGNAINAAIAATRLGKSCCVISPTGAADNDMRADLESERVTCHWTESNAGTRQCLTIIDRAEKTVTELVENGRALEPKELDSFLSVCSKHVPYVSVLALTGSLPMRVPIVTYKRILTLANCPTIVDAVGEGLLSVLRLNPTIVRLNRTELEKTIGKSIHGDGELIAAMRTLNEQGAQWIVTSQGAGAVWVTSASDVFRIVPPKVTDVINSTGCGDAMTGGIAVGLVEGQSIMCSIQLGVVAATQNTQSLFPGRIYEHETRKLLERIMIERVLRD